MQIAVCEDLRQDCDQLCRLIEDYCRAQQLEAQLVCFDSGEALLEQYQPGRYHILFLDVLMEGCDGMETAARVRRLDGDVTIIFVTVSREFAVDSYLVDAAFYLVKPVDPDSLALAMSRCRHLLQQHAKFISVVESRHGVDIRLRDIFYVESQRNDCVVHTCHGQVRTRAKLSELETDLAGGDFLRCHRSFVVNLRRVEDMRETDFILQNGTRVPISRAYSTQVQQEFRRFLFAEARRATNMEQLPPQEPY